MKIIRGLCHFFVWLCMALIAALMLLMVAEVLCRNIFGKAILGSTEWAQVLLVCTLSSFGASILCNRQIKINILTSRLKPKAQVILEIIILTLTFVTIAVLSWRQFNYAITSNAQHVFYNNINLPQWPFIAVFAMSYGIAALTVLFLVIRKIASLFNGDWENEAKREDTDEIFAFGRKVFTTESKPVEGKDITDGGDGSGT